MTIAFIIFLLIGGGLLGVFSRQIVFERLRMSSEDNEEVDQRNVLSLIKNQLLGALGVAGVFLGPSWLRASIFAAVAISLAVYQAKQLKEVGVSQVALTVQITSIALCLLAIFMLCLGFFLLYEATNGMIESG